MAKKIIYTVVAVVGLAAASGAAWWYQSRPVKATEVSGLQAEGSGKGAPAPGAIRPAGVEVARTERVSIQDDAESVGTLRSRQSVMLRPEVAGRVKALGFNDGARVRKNQLLVQLDDTLQRAEVSQAQAQVSIAQANFKRNQELVAQNFVAQRVLEESSANLQVAQAQLALAVARLSRMAILAPFDGTVGLRNVNLGDYVKDGADLVNLEDIRSMYVDFRLPERYQGKLKAQQEVALSLDAYPGRAFKARIEAIDPLIDANGRSVSVRAVLPNTLGESVLGGKRLQGGVAVMEPLRPGMFARVKTVFSVNDAALVVPEEAIVPQGGRQFVIKVVTPAELLAPAANLPSGTEFVSLRQEVQLGSRRSGKVEITQGLVDGQTVVVAGQQRLQRDGTPLRIVALGRPPQDAASTPVPAASR
ncbi:MAG: efflux RND transporter periplasmic adaptor subunit [Candidatus Saccharibacteria bacterium]|nr:efflux RND transporter periplasmic adaptor subunit [Rhodoferax sp.]